MLKIKHIGKRIIIIGNSGGGKSTVSRKFGDMLGLPVTHLDYEYWNAGWVKTPTDKWEEKVRTMIAEPEWILEGNFAGTLELRLGRADTVIFLDYNRFFCLRGAVKRWFANRGKTRPDMAEGCPEKIDYQFIKWILWDFPRRSRKKIVQCLAEFGGTKIILKNRSELERLLERQGEPT